MAKIPTGRIVLYAILGVVVIVLAVVMIRTRSQEAKLGKRVMEVEDVPKFIKNITKRVEKLDGELAGLSGPSADQARQLLQEVRTGIDEIQTMNNPDELGKKRDEIMDKLTEAQKLKRKAEKGE
ncbi:hypothetical protein HPY86_02735 [candidate division WOR-3 bacterium]|jgi:hypothetical protein|nr:hypothetical protein [candidate division WOR-3 bacterium]